jgi:hypothetical protein
MRQGVLVVLAAFAALLTAPSAGAAFEVRISVNPSIVEAGRVVRIELRAFTLDGGKHMLADDPGRGRRSEVVSPSGRVLRVALRHVAPGIWRGTYRFPTVGRWRVRVANWPNGGQGPQLTVQVRPPKPLPATTTTAATTTTGTTTTTTTTP